MYSLLIVDDEEYAVKALVQGIAWSELNITNVFGSYYAEDAIDILAKHDIDVLICDIQMPGKDGFKILEWVKNNHLLTKVILLTAHADFSYAQAAISAGIENYLLKPVQYNILKETVQKALNSLSEEKQYTYYHELYKKSHDIWRKNLPLMIERFWQDVLSRRFYLTKERLKNFARMYNLPLDGELEVILCLIGVDEWADEIEEADEDIMEYGLRNIAEEVILKNCGGAVIQDHYGNNICIIYNDAKQSGCSEKVKSNCEAYIQACKTYLNVNLCCYLSKPVAICDIIEEYNGLFQMQRYNLTKYNSVITKENVPKTDTKKLTLPFFLEFENHFETENNAQMIEEIQSFFSSINKTNASSETLELIYYGVVHMIYDLCDKKGISVTEIYDSDFGGVTPNTASIERLKAWCIGTVGKCLTFFEDRASGSIDVIEQTKKYLREHYKEQIKRDNIANYVHLNSSYLSKMFKEKTGMGIVDYLTQLRINNAKKLLLQTDKKISAIALEVGYSHFSHFAGTFKKQVGVTPQDYRRDYNTIDKE